MITERKGNIVDVKQGVIIHGCNAQGVMGSGVAKALRTKYPQTFDVYKQHLKLAKDESINPLGHISIYEHDEELSIVNAITQEYYGRDGKQYVSYKAIRNVFDEVFMWQTADVHFPLIGCGRGGGDWNIVSEIIENSAREFNYGYKLNLWRL